MKHDILVWNEGINSTFNHTQEQINSLNNINKWVEYIHEDDREELLNSLNEAIKGKADYWEGEYRLLTGTKDYAEVLDRAYIKRDETGKATRLYGVIENHTEKNARSRSIDLAGSQGPKPTKKQSKN